MSTLRLVDDDDTLRTKFANLGTREDVASLLDVNEEELRYYLFKAKRYQTFQIQKRSGGTRKISSPANSLKIIQRKLNQVLHAVYRRRSPVHGFTRDRSIRSNAERHLGATWLVNFDLSDFFPSIHFGRVKGLFAKQPYQLPEEAARTLAQICCDDKQLPAGAPTSPVVANMICAKLDAQLKALAKSHGCMYTRYADDITISTRSKRLPPQIAYRDSSLNRWVLSDDLKSIVHQNLFQINEPKTHVRNKTSRQEITGIKINEGLNVSRQLIRQVRAMLHAWEYFGETAAEKDFRDRWDSKQRKNSNPSFRRVLRGKLEFIGFIRGRDDELYLRLLYRFLSLDSDLKSRPVTIGPTAKDAVFSHAVWLLLGKGGEPQGTAFAAQGYNLLTAAHCVEEPMWASRPGIDSKSYPITVIRRDEIRDIAEVTIQAKLPVQLKIGSDTDFKAGELVNLLGYPKYHVGDSLGMRRGRITQFRPYNKIPHYLIDADIVRGNSGGPVLNSKHEVIGIAVKGMDTPGYFTKYDQLSSFVPVSLLTFLKHVTPNANSQAAAANSEIKPGAPS